MKRADLDILLDEDAGSMLEYKEALSSSLARDFNAFANTVGGKILLGVRDEGTAIGVADTNALRPRIQDIARNCGSGSSRTASEALPITRSWNSSSLSQFPDWM